MTKSDETIVLVLVGLYVYSKLSQAQNPQPGSPNFVGPVQIWPTIPSINWKQYCFDASGQPYLNPDPSSPCPTA